MNLILIRSRGKRAGLNNYYINAPLVELLARQVSTKPQPPPAPASPPRTRACSGRSRPPAPSPCSGCRRASPSGRPSAATALQTSENGASASSGTSPMKSLVSIVPQPKLTPHAAGELGVQLHDLVHVQPVREDHQLRRAGPRRATATSGSPPLPPPPGRRNRCGCRSSPPASRARPPGTPACRRCRAG